MKTNIIDKYELINGTAIIDHNFVIVTANESFYRFIGISTFYTVIDIIHQVDLDDFINVANSLKPDTEKTMVLRVKRFDNTYRWMLTKVKRCHSNKNLSVASEYIELHISDILVIEEHRSKYYQELKNCNHIMAVEGNIYFSYDCKSKLISFYTYVDQRPMQMSECPLDIWITQLIDNNSTDQESIHNLHLMHEDFIHHKNEFKYQIISDFLSYEHRPERLTILASTVYDNSTAINIVGCMKNYDFPEGYSRYTNIYANYDENLSLNEVNQYIDENIVLNEKIELSLILMEINNIDQIKEEKGEEFVHTLYSSILKTAKDQVGYRGVVGSYKFGVIYIAVKYMVSDLDIRAFIESLRNQIAWNFKQQNEKSEITLSIGISRRPYNGLNSGILFNKAQKALAIAHQKGKNKYILYLENVHGDFRN